MVHSYAKYARQKLTSAWKKNFTVAFFVRRSNVLADHVFIHVV
jgi:hypothetical protein